MADSGMDMRVRVGRNLRQYRLAKGVSQEELAHRCALDRTYVSGIERGVRNPTVVVLERLAAVLGIEASDLLRADEPTGQSGHPTQ
jgi:transcriptional regulator with XRE-family HTH domain